MFDKRYPGIMYDRPPYKGTGYPMGIRFQEFYKKVKSGFYKGFSFGYLK